MTIESPVWSGRAQRLNDFRRMRSVRRVAGSGVEYLASGNSGPALLILNGGSLIADTAEPITTLFEAGFRTFTPTHPPLRTMVERVKVLCELLDQEGVDRALVLGQSFGGMLAQALIVEAPQRVSKVVLSATGSPMLPAATLEALTSIVNRLGEVPDAELLASTKAQFSTYLPKTLDAGPFWDAVVEDLFGHVLRADDLRAFYASSFDFFSKYSQQAQTFAAWPGETLIVRADDDPALTAVDPSRLDILLPRARIHRFATGGHMLSVTQRQPYYEVVSKFLAA